MRGTTSREAARELKDLMDRRINDGHGDQGFSGLFELLAKRP
jgi:hypothetical protein